LLRFRSAALGLMLALTPAVHAAFAQTAPPPSDSASKPAEPAVPNFFRDIQANAFASLGYISNLNMPQDQTIGLRYFDNRANTFSVDLAELVVQKAVAKAGDAGFRIDLTAGTGGQLRGTARQLGRATHGAAHLLLRRARYAGGHRSARTSHALLRHSLRGHRPDAELADHLFPGLRALGNVGEIRTLQRKTARFKLFVVAGYAVLIQQGCRRRILRPHRAYRHE